MKWIWIVAIAIPLASNPLTLSGAESGRRSHTGWLAWGPRPARAQQTPDADSGRSRMRTFLVLRISEALELPDEKALQISKILRDTDDKRRALVAQRRDVERNLRSALQQKGTDPTAIAKLVAQANDLDSQIAMLPESSFRQVQELLTPEQQARLVLLRPELQAQIRRNVERRLRERAGN
jgi:Spy/CpxP family protein refolding chaperone